MKYKTLNICLIAIVSLFFILNGCHIQETDLHSTCNSSYFISNLETDSLITHNIKTTQYWMSFDAGSSVIRIEIDSTNKSPIAKIRKLYLYSGTCEKFKQIGYCSYESSIQNEDHKLQILSDSLIKGNTYYIKVEQEIPTDSYFGVIVQDLYETNWGPNDCPHNCDLIANSDIESSVLNPDTYIPFYYSQIPCWCAAWGSPRWGWGNWKGAIYMGSGYDYGNNTSLKSEGVYQTVNIKNGNKYKVEFLYRRANPNHPPGKLFVKFTNDNFGCQGYWQNAYETQPGLSPGQLLGEFVPPNVGANNNTVSLNNIIANSNYNKILFYVNYIQGYSAGASSEIYISDIHIYPNWTLTVNSGSDQTICLGLPTTLSAAANPVDIDNKFLWNNGLTTPQISVTPSSTTTYTVQVKDVNGCVATDAVTVFVTKPIADFNLYWPSFCFSAGRGIYCDDQSTCHSGIANWLWDFGDGTTSNNQDGTHGYNQPGTYMVTLTITDLNGNTSSANKQVIVHPLPPKPIISGINNTCDNNTLTFSITNADIVNNTYVWNVNPLSNFTNITYGPNKTTATITFIPNLPNNSPTRIIASTMSQFGCVSQVVYHVFGCCFYPYETDTVLNDEILSQSFSNKRIAINGTLVIPANSSYSFNSCSLQMGAESKIQIGNNSVLTIDDYTELFAACGYMWDGIYINSSAKLVFNNSTLKDAMNGIISSNGGDFQITNSTFRENYTSLIVNNYAPDMPPNGIIPPHPGKIYNTTITTLYPLKPPHSGDKAKSGIVVNKVNDLTIGDINFGANNFSNMICGIICYNSYVNIYNNNFTNLYKTNASPSVDVNNNPIEGGVIALKNSTWIVNISDQLIVGGAGNKTNTFTSCNFGIFTSGLKSLINNNTFDTKYSAIICKELKSGTEINNNIITQSSGTDMPGTSILLQNSTLLPLGILVTVANNLIKPKTGSVGFTTGIYLKNLKSGNINKVIVSKNDISFTCSTCGWRTGIKVENCDAMDISCNSIHKNSSPAFIDRLSLQGIKIKNSINAKLHGGGMNGLAISSMGSGIVGEGNLTGTMFYCNKLNENYFGFSFINGTILSNQGNSNIASDNYWSSNITGSRRINPNNPLSTATQIKWYYFGIPNITNNYYPDIKTLDVIHQYIIQSSSNSNTNCYCQ